MNKLSRTWRWLKARWPLTWRSTVVKQSAVIADQAFMITGQANKILRMASEIEKMTGELALANIQMKSMQSRIAKWLGNGPYQDSLSLHGIIRTIERHRHEYAVCMSDPIATVVHSEQRYERVKVLKFACDIGLSEHMPPEMLIKDVSEMVSKKVIAALMQEYRCQSILLNNDFKDVR